MVIKLTEWEFKSNIARNTTFEGDQDQIFAHFW